MKNLLKTGGSRLLLALTPLALVAMMSPGIVSGQTRDAGAEKRLLAAFNKRSMSCAPKAPIETEIAFDKAPGFRRTTRIELRVMSMEPGPGAEVRFDLPPQVTLRGGKLLENGVLQPKKAYVFGIDAAVTGMGHFEVHATVMAGLPEARFGRRETLYIDSDGSNVVVTTKKPSRNTTGVSPTLMGSGVNEVVTDDLMDPTWGPPPVKDDPTNDFNDDNGLQLLHGPAVKSPFGSAAPGAAFANVTVSGTWRYRHGDNTLHNGYGTTVYFWDDDTVSGDDLMATAAVGDDGSFSATFDNNDPEGGTTDLYVEFRTSNGALNVHYSGGLGNHFSTATAVIQNNIPNGSFNAGSWYADWGTNGVADDNERAWEVLDYMSRAWAHANYSLGYSPHYTYVQWYDGSTDGTYYRPSEDQIHLSEMDFNSPDVLMHEFGHNLMDSAYGEVYIPNSGGSHWFTNHYNTALAMSEGFGTWFACTAQGNEWFYNDNNPGNLINFDCDTNWDGNGAGNGNSDNASNSPNWGYDTESAVLALMLDLDDGRNDPTDPFDWVSLGDNEIWDVIRFYNPPGGDPHVYGIQQFYDGWAARGWINRPQLNGQMHNHGMKQGIGNPALGLSSGVSVYAGTWYYGGYGRGSYVVRNYSSVPYDLNRCYVWLRGPGGEDIGQFGSDGDGTPIAAGATRSVYLTADQTGYNPGAPNFVYGTYTITAGHYRSDNVWQLLAAAEPGAATTVTRNVVEDTDAPNYCTATDDGVAQNSSSTLHVYATAADFDSSIKSYWTRVGTSPYAGDEQDWVEHPANNQNTFDYTISGLSMNANTTYYITVVARNIENLDTWATTDGIISYDVTAPGPVGVADDGTWTPNLTQLHVVATSTESDGAMMGYWTRVGTSPGGGDEQDWVFNATGDVDLFDHTITGLSLTIGQTYYITVVARNMSGLDSFGYSDGIRAVDTPRTLTINSVNPNSGVNIGITADLNGATSGTTSFARVYENGTSISVNVPGQVGTQLFDHIEVDGAVHTGPLTMDADHTITAVYVNGYSVSIQSTNPNSGVNVMVWNNDFYNRNGGLTTFSRLYKDGKPCSMTAPASAGGNWFSHWVLDGVTVPGTSRTLSMTMNMAHTARAVYATGRTLTVNSVNPASGVPITVWLADKLGQSNGTTSFTRQYANGASVPLTAPQVVGTSYFQRWDLNGAPWQATATVNVPMSANQTVSAVYATGQTVSVTASEPAVPITVWIQDRAGLRNGNTDFTRLYPTGTQVSFTAPATANGKTFIRWDKDGVPVAGGSRTVKFPADAPHTIRAVYIP